MFNFEHLEAFHAVADFGSFSKAAVHLHKTQPAISQAIRQLETQVGKVLIIRERKNIHLSPEGKVLYKHSSESLKQLENAFEIIKNSDQDFHKHLSICTSTLIATNILPPCIRIFREKFPDIEISVGTPHVSEIEKQVRHRKIDIGIILPPIDEPGLKCHEVSRFKRVVVCPKNHPFSQKNEISLKELAAQPLIVLDPDSRTRKEMESVFLAAGAELKPQMELSSTTAILEMVRLGLGLAVVPDFATTHEPKGSNLKIIRIRGNSFSQRIMGIHHPYQTETDTIRVFFEILKQHFEK